MKNLAAYLLIASAMGLPLSANAYLPEYLDRGAVAYMPGRAGMMLSWRSLSSDDPNMVFEVYRNDKLLATLSNATSYKDLAGKASYNYVIKAVLNGEVVETFEPMLWNSMKKISLNRPEGGVTPDDEVYTYAPNDCSVGDFDGDGQYEIVMKWEPSNAHDNSHNGYTGNVYLDCYQLDGTQLWRIDLGKNIRAGGHYTQFMVYDFDGDGKAELICKTGPGTKDGTGTYVNLCATDPEIAAADPEKDWRTSVGRINGGQEWLTVFAGTDGKAVHTVYYNPNRNGTLGGDKEGTLNWATDGKNDAGGYGNRGERYLACVAHLDGIDKPASAIMCRGYYTYAFVWAVDFDGKELSTRWLHSSRTTTSYTVTDSKGKETEYTPGPATKGSGSRTAFGNGNHNISVADVDGDGCDEIIWGSCAFNNDGTLLYSTGYGHGDAIHVGKMIPSREGLQVYQVHEASPFGWDLHDAATGEIINSNTADKDTGRGCAADIDPDYEGWETWCAYDNIPRNAITGKRIGTGSPAVNFRIYWDGDLQDELYDGTTITKWTNGAVQSLVTLTGASCNGTKATPCLVADILGDWREEVILYDPNTCSDIYIHSTTITTDNKVPCLMQDPQYRMSICWQNVAYNQPPHLGYYLPDINKTSSITDISMDRPEDKVIVYSATTGIKVSEIKGTDANTVANLSSGVYIVRDGYKVTKQIVK